MTPETPDRGHVQDVCPECGSPDYMYGYGPSADGWHSYWTCMECEHYEENAEFVKRKGGEP